MAQVQQFANNAFSTLAGAITNTSLAVNLASGGGALFPHPGANQYFVGTFIDEATGLLNEIVWVTNVTGDTLTIIRAQEGTEAQAWNAGDLFQALLTAGSCSNFLQEGEAQTNATNFAVDTGVANAYVAAFTPPITAHLPGSPLWVKIANANSGASTFNDGAGSLPIINPDGTALGSGTFAAGGIYCLVNDGNGHFQMLSASDEALSSQGILQTGDFKWRPTSETLSGYVPACGSTGTIGNATSGANIRANADTLNLFTWLWTNFSNTQCPVLPSGRGASAAADFNNNKTIGLIGLSGIIQGGMDNMGGLASNNWNGVPAISGNSSTPGSLIGETFHTLTAGQIPTITGLNTNAPGYSLQSGVTTSNLIPTNLSATGGAGGAQQTVASTSNSSVTGSITIGADTIAFQSNNTGSGSHNNVQPVMMGTFYIKL